jgi:AraC-like DNA-binding protein
MTWEIKGMIARCIGQMSRDACGDCGRRNACTSIFNALLFDAAPGKCAEKATGSSSGSSFLSFLGQIAKEFVRGPMKRERAFRSEVEGRMGPLLASGNVRIGVVARELGCSRQTLYRRLKSEGVTFEQLLDDLRRRLALRFIREEGMSVKNAAYRLGFSDPSAFSRAFKRWTGVSPTGMRRP